MKCGIVDVGSNTIRLSIYHWEGQTFKLLMNKKEMAGLAGYIKNGLLSDSGILVACRVLAGFKALLRNFDIADLYVFGTASLRNIVNTEEALETIEAVTGIKVEVLSGADEAAFSFLGATVGGGAPGSGMLADVGGGSTELVAYRDGAITSGCSLPMGSLSLFTKHVSGLFPTKEERKAIRSDVKEELEKAKTAGLRCSHLTGVGGTFRAAAKLCNDLSGADPDNRIIPAGEIHALYKGLKKGDQDTLRQILRSVPDRVHTILPGLAILTAILDAYKVSTVSVSACGVREGYLLRRVMEGTSHDQ
ncbi:phosphatase [uncultured Flavonifractor sp.]|uniref:Phosphatase n=1 Tax=Candidatus Flavonifractor intestinigallinarum TaxID=2838586 RepID=A0A9D2MNZ5_9FIRM|nr:phosphatase [uncultured Flavonifractor sp.]HJB81414.1 phosphatase [Candidatus Flavonifractor intestinigallinarum]